MKKIIYIIILALLTFTSCNRDIENINVGGFVKSDTDKALSNVNVTVICWKYGDSPDQSYTEDETKTIITDKKGRYQVDFDKGAFIEVKVSLNGYVDGHETKEIHQKKNTIDIILKQQ